MMLCCNIFIFLIYIIYMYQNTIKVSILFCYYILYFIFILYCENAFEFNMILCFNILGMGFYSIFICYKYIDKIKNKIDKLEWNSIWYIKNIIFSIFMIGGLSYKLSCDNPYSFLIFLVSIYFFFSIENLKSKYFIFLIKIIGFFLIIFVASISVEPKSFDLLMSLVFISLYFFILLSLRYFLFINENKIRDKILDIWKIYFPVVILMIGAIISLESTRIQVDIDYKKTICMYNIKNNIDSNQSCTDYKDSVDSFIRETFKQQDNNQSDKDKIDYCKKNKETKKQPSIYYEFLLMVIIVMSIFSFLWLIIEINNFYIKLEKKKKKKILKTIKKKKKIL